MYIHISAVVFTFCILEVNSQVFVKVTDVTERPVCDQNVRLRCTYTGTSACCTTLTRLWRRDGTQIMNGGVATPSDKYNEEVNSADNYFDIIILNTNETDFEKDYSCEYGFSTSVAYSLKEDAEKRGECAGKDYGCSLIGTLLMVVVIFIIAWKLFSGRNKCAMVIGVLSFVISASINAVVAVPCGYLINHCLCKSGLEFAFIPLGLFTAAVTGAILVKIYNRDSGESTSGSQGSCWPPCNVGPEPEEKTNRSPQRAHKTEKPVGVTRPQPPKPSAQHLRSDNESNLEMVPKGRPLPPLTSQWPQPTPESDDIPQKRALPPLTSTAEPVEKKKKKKKKKLDEEDNDD